MLWEATSLPCTKKSPRTWLSTTMSAAPAREHVQLIGLPAVQSISDEQRRCDRHFAILQWTPGERRFQSAKIPTRKRFGLRAIPSVECRKLGGMEMTRYPKEAVRKSRPGTRPRRKEAHRSGPGGEAHVPGI